MNVSNTPVRTYDDGERAISKMLHGFEVILNARGVILHAHCRPKGVSMKLNKS